MDDELQRHIIYDETQIKFLQQSIEDERRYRLRAEREKETNHRKLTRYWAAMVILGFHLLWFALLMIWINNLRLKGGLSESQTRMMLFFMGSAEQLAYIIFGPIMIFIAVFFGICVAKVVKYSKRINGDIDWRTYKYKTYDDMKNESVQREQQFGEELLEMTVKLEADHAAAEARRIAAVSESQMKCISDDELKQIAGDSDDEKKDEPAGMGHILSEEEMYLNAARENEMYKKELQEGSAED